MKNLIVLISIIILLSSCNHKKQQALNQRIEKLEVQNKLLMDSIVKITTLDLLSCNLEVIPESCTLKLHKNNRFTGRIVEQRMIRKYNVYKIDTIPGSTEVEKKLLLKDQRSTKFDFDYIPKSKKDNLLQIEVLFDVDTAHVFLGNYIRLNTALKH